MRIKFLAVIMSFLCVSIAATSCLDSDTEYEFSSDASIQAFGLDTIYGKHYTFTIDQLNRLIYNRDSLPMGADTIIDKILIDTMYVTGWITAGVSDTLFNSNDSVDLRPAMNNDAGMKFKAHAADGLAIREYTLKINVHQQDPDSLIWNKLTDNLFSNLVNDGEQKAVIMNETLFVYASSTTLYSTSTAPGRFAWSEIAVTGLPENAHLSTIVVYNQALYLTTADKQVYTSTNGNEWIPVNTLGNNVVALISGLTDGMTGIVEIRNKLYFNVTRDGKTWEGDTSTLEAVPDDFPTKQLVSTLSHTGNGMEKLVVTGMPLPTASVTVPWFTMDGYHWANLASTTYDVYCPGIQNPFITYYANNFYCFGGELDAIYKSITGIAWEKTEKKFLLPAEFKGKRSYSILVEPTIDKNIVPQEKRDFIWVIFGGNGTPNEVWRGRLNKLGFIIQ